MPPTLPISLSNFPAFQTRKALLIIDLQNEFLSPGGSLPVSEPIGYIERGLNVAKRFRESGAGDVFWIRSQFDAHRPTANAHIITSSTPLLAGPRTAPGSRSSSSGGSSRGHRKSDNSPGNHAQLIPDPDADPEAFLSITGSSPASAAPGAAAATQPPHSQHNMLPGSFGSEMAPQVASAIDARQDLIIAKSHYSAFESTQLLMRLRTRFVTELYIFGALTNVSIYATALDAARHGLTLTIVEDCCGYRDAMRHNNALQSLVRLTGCDTVLADDLLDTLPTASSHTHQAPTAETSASGALPENDIAAAIAAITASSHGPPGARRAGFGGSSMGRGLPVRTKGKTGPSSLPPTSSTRSANLPPTAAPASQTPNGHSPGRGPQSAPSVASVEESQAEPNCLASTACDDRVTAGATTNNVPAPAPTRITSTLLGVDAGEMTPDDGDNGVLEANRDPDDSFVPVLPSKSAKILEYSRLRAQQKQQKEQKQEQEGEGGDSCNIGELKPGHPLLQDQKQNAKLREMDTVVAVSNTPNESRQASQPAILAARKDTLTEEAVMRSMDTIKETPTSPPEEAAAPEVATATAAATKAAEAAEADAAAPEEVARASKPAENTLENMPESVPGVSSETMTPKAPATSVADPHPALVDTNIKPIGTGPICAGDTIIYHDVLPAALEQGIYERLLDEVQWQRMSHQGGEVPRLVCVQGGGGSDNSSGSNEGDAIPVYRHPADELPPLEAFTPTVLQIKQHVESIAGHPLNHVLIQHYRSGNDYISEHSDKTLDIVPGSFICNMSVGAERTMVFRTKRRDKSPPRTADDHTPREDGFNNTRTDIITGGGSCGLGDEGPDLGAAAAGATKRQSCRVQLPHNSLCRMGLETNMKWLHAIRQDKRADRDKAPPELAFGGRRISLTFRRIGTFLNKSETLIWGQGAVAKTRAEARPVVYGPCDDAVSMLQAFGTENRSSSFDWARYYGHGFDVLQMSNAPRFFASADMLVNTTVQLLLAELGISHAKGSMGVVDSAISAANAKEDTLSSLAVAVRFVDNDPDRSTVHGLLAILLYLDSVYGAGPGSAQSGKQQGVPQQNIEAAQAYTRLQKALLLQDAWRPASHAATRASCASTGDTFSLKPWAGELLGWNAHVSPAPHGKGATEDRETTNREGNEVLFVAGGASPTLADYVFWPVLYSMEQALGTTSSDSKNPPPRAPSSALETELKRMGMSPLARYYAQLKSRASFGRVILAREKQR